jgi:toxin YoeB
MNIIFSPYAWDDYVDWQTSDKKILKAINELIKIIQRTPYEGKGNPELLKHNLSGYWSRRIDLAHRLVYNIDESEELIRIYACKGHYI